jgi:hypothetical protein
MNWGRTMVCWVHGVLRPVSHSESVVSGVTRPRAEGRGLKLHIARPTPSPAKAVVGVVGLGLRLVRVGASHLGLGPLAPEVVAARGLDSLRLDCP